MQIDAHVGVLRAQRRCSDLDHMPKHSYACENRCELLKPAVALANKVCDAIGAALMMIESHGTTHRYSMSISLLCHCLVSCSPIAFAVDAFGVPQLCVCSSDPNFQPEELQGTARDNLTHHATYPVPRMTWSTDTSRARETIALARLRIFVPNIQQDGHVMGLKELSDVKMCCCERGVSCQARFEGAPVDKRTDGRRQCSVRTRRS
jgi:hypothetical protein